MSYFGTELLIALKPALKQAGIHFKEPLYRGDLLLGVQTDRLLRDQQDADAFQKLAESGTPAFKSQAQFAADLFRYGSDSDFFDPHNVLVRRSEATLPFGIPAKLCYDIRIEKPTGSVLDADDVEGAILSATIDNKLHEDVRIYVREKNQWEEFFSVSATPGKTYSAESLDDRIVFSVSAPYDAEHITRDILRACQHIHVALGKANT